MKTLLTLTLILTMSSSALAGGSFLSPRNNCGCGGSACEPPTEDPTDDEEMHDESFLISLCAVNDDDTPMEDHDDE